MGFGLGSDGNELGPDKILLFKLPVSVVIKNSQYTIQSVCKRDLKNSFLPTSVEHCIRKLEAPNNFKGKDAVVPGAIGS